MKELKSVEAIEALRRRVKKGETITLLCYCKEGEHCHRDIIKSMIEEKETSLLLINEVLDELQSL